MKEESSGNAGNASRSVRISITELWIFVIKIIDKNQIGGIDIKNEIHWNSKWIMYRMSETHSEDLF